MSKPDIDFRSTAVDLAEQLQAANVSIVELVDALDHGVQTIAVLKKYMTPAQVLHAQLEIDALATKFSQRTIHAPIGASTDFNGQARKKD